MCRGCAEATCSCTAKCQACGRVLMQGESFHISKALTSCGHEGCTGCVKAKVRMTRLSSMLYLRVSCCRPYILLLFASTSTDNQQELSHAQQAPKRAVVTVLLQAALTEFPSLEIIESWQP